MKNNHKHELLKAVTLVGYNMLLFGAEIYRVESSISLMLQTYDICKEDIEVFAIPSCIIVTVMDENGVPITVTKRVQSRNTDLDKVDKLNALSREICKKAPIYSEIYAEINKILALKVYPIYLNILAYSAIASLFSLFFGGTFLDSANAFILGALICCIKLFLVKLKAKVFFICIICSGITAFLALLSVHLGLSDSSDMVIIGTLMTLVPGMALTNCMRDFIAGDLMAGLSSMAEALLIATGIAIGVMLPLTLLKNVF